MGDSVVSLALKEWAVTIKALDDGKQILLLRKGGIREEGKDFRVIHPHFLLYPTYERQKDALLKGELHPDLHHTLEEYVGDGVVTLSHWARVEETIEITEQEKVDALSPYYIWTRDYAQKRLHWKPRKPLSIMLLKVCRLAQPRSLPVIPEYDGCKSWVNLAEEVSLGDYSPVLNDAEFQHQVKTVKQALR